jgi:hypothetical protein
MKDKLVIATQETKAHREVLHHRKDKLGHAVASNCTETLAQHPKVVCLLKAGGFLCVFVVDTSKALKVFNRIPH